MELFWGTDSAPVAGQVSCTPEAAPIMIRTLVEGGFNVIVAWNPKHNECPVVNVDDWVCTLDWRCIVDDEWNWPVGEIKVWESAACNSVSVNELEAAAREWLINR